MSVIISITELRQRLFQLADRVVETGEPLLIERRGVRLRLVREGESTPKGRRLSRLAPRKQSVVVGPPLDPHESPAQWSEIYPKVAEPASKAWSKPK
ncbi:MAG: type II toxin-antitoxin system Phd/YefM family antitoxin [Rhodanobacteraceae bacterium]